MKKPRAVGGAIACAVAVLAVGVMLVNMPPLTECLSTPQGGTKQYWFHARRIVVQPWLGPHRVYAVFVLPEQYKFDHLYSAKLMIQGFETEFSASSPEVGDAEPIHTEPGHYAKRVYLPTRTALWFLITGRFGDLRSTCHWWLAIIDKGWHPTSPVREG